MKNVPNCSPKINFQKDFTNYPFFTSTLIDFRAPKLIVVLASGMEYKHFWKYEESKVYDVYLWAHSINVFAHRDFLS